MSAFQPVEKQPDHVSLEHEVLDAGALRRRFPTFAPGAGTVALDVHVVNGRSRIIGKPVCVRFLPK